ncbi:MAG: citrate synthase [Armatimonadetes bacterium]|nr:citrate synthase [Armatimonadota bacterium]
MAKAVLGEESIELPIVVGTEGERAIDIGQLRNRTGYITLDDGYANTGSCKSAITFIDGERGILRYRGYPIEELAERSRFTEVAYLLIEGHLPTHEEEARFSRLLTENELLHEDMRFHFEGFPSTGHPMAILSSIINAQSCFYPELLLPDKQENFEIMAARLMSQVRTVAAYAYRKSRGLPFIYPNPDFKYSENLLHMMFSLPYKPYDLKEEVIKALDLIFLLHADHEQNCSTSTVRMVASSGANLFACVAAGVCALWGPLHGGANQAVLEMLNEIHRSGDDGSNFIEMVKDPANKQRLMGFGHRVYKNFDPRAKIIKAQSDRLLAALNLSDPLLDVAQRLEEKALSDPYFVDRKLYPNVDFYSGIMMRAIGIPVAMFTVMFAIGRMPGWIAHYKEILDSSKSRIDRPRQIYVGERERHYVPRDQR